MPSVHEQDFKNLEAEKGMANLDAKIETSTHDKYRQNQSSKTRNYKYTKYPWGIKLAK